MSRLFVIADIHGRRDLLDKLLEKLFTEEKLDLTVDKLIFTGDMIDRGPDSKGVLVRVKALTEQYPGNVIALAGNHEWLAIDAHIKPSYDNQYLWEINGGDATLASFDPSYNGGLVVADMEGNLPKYMHKIPYDWIKWLGFLPLKHEEPGFFFSHAPVPRENRRNILWRGTPDFAPDELIWSYPRDGDEWGYARIHAPDVVGVCGHVHALHKGVLAPRFYDHYIYADAGCGCSPKAPLCAIEVKTRKVIYAKPTV